MPDPSLVLPLLLQSVIVPFGVTLALLCALRRQPALLAIGPAVGFAAAYFAAFHAQWSLLPRQALDWMPAIAVFGAAGAIAVERLRHAALRGLARVALALAAAALIGWPALAGLGWQKVTLSVALTGLLAGVAWSGLARAAQSRPTPLLLLALVAGGAALALTIDASLAIGQLSGALASALAACALLTMARSMPFPAAAVGVAVLLLAVLLLNAVLYAGFASWQAALLAGGLLADPLVHAIRRRRDSGAAAWFATALLAAVPVLTVIGLALRAAQDMGGY